MIAARLGDKDKVRLLARNYLQRFALSPYSEDFFRQLVDALMEIKGKISNEEIEEIASLAWPGARLPFYLRIARGAIVSGNMQRARFASERADALACALKADDTQAKLYLAVSNVGSDKTGDAKFMLSRLPRERLHDRDIKLLEAATAMAGKILAQPIPGTGYTAERCDQKRQCRSCRLRGPSSPVEQPRSMIDETRKKLDAIDALLGKARK